MLGGGCIAIGEISSLEGEFLGWGDGCHPVADVAWQQTGQGVRQMLETYL